MWKSHCHNTEGVWHPRSQEGHYWMHTLFLFLGLAISFAMLEVLCCAKKVSLYPKASQQPAKTGIKRGKHCYVLPSSGEEEAKVNNARAVFRSKLFFYFIGYFCIVSQLQTSQFVRAACWNEVEAYFQLHSREPDFLYKFLTLGPLGKVVACCLAFSTTF